MALVGQGLGQVDRVEAGELGRGQLDQTGPDGRVGAVDRGPAAVAVNEGDGTLGPIAIGQTSDLSRREAQDPCRLIGGQGSGEQVGEDIQAVLCSAVQADRLPRLHGVEGDKVAVPLART